jgi:hypothetical protein
MLFASVVQVGVLLMFVTKPFSLSCGSCVILMPLVRRQFRVGLRGRAAASRKFLLKKNSKLDQFVSLIKLYLFITSENIFITPPTTSRTAVSIVLGESNHQPGDLASRSSNVTAHDQFPPELQ